MTLRNRKVFINIYYSQLDFSEDEDFVEEKPLEPRPYKTDHEDETI